jgi:hypothetical protein
VTYLFIGIGHIAPGEGEADWLTVFAAGQAMALAQASAYALAEDAT